ncbi:hypothetical protein [Wukongibacter sp. M2B1]|uniref:hypothetical protein n=1 Tax=Wukongibacter sp. M2B1 TaxID=3088895 RepID=UPI003D79C2FA
MKLDISSDWEQYKEIYAKAKVFINEKFFNSYEFAKYISKIDFDNLEAELSKVNGFFSFIKKEKNKCIIVSDRVRSIPLFYTKDSSVYVTDNLYDTELKKTYNDVSKLELLLTGCVSGSDTLYEGINQTQAGEIITIQNDKIHSKFYFKLEHDFNINEGLSIDDLIDSHLDILKVVFQRLIRYADGRTIVIPLSGGYDSRLTALMMKKLSYDNVITFTFGREKNGESILSKQVANDLEYPWIFIPYTNKYTNEVYNTRDHEEYESLPDNLFNICQDRDWPAVWELKKKGLVPKDSVFVPGYSGDFLAAFMRPQCWETNGEFNENIIADAIIDKHYIMWRRKKDFVKKNIKLYYKLITQIKQNRTSTFYEAINNLKYWEFLQIQVKYIINAVKVYEFWGYDWWMPLWDKEYMDFWLKIPYKYLEDRRLYNQTVAETYSEISGRSLEEAFIRATGNRVHNPIKERSHLKQFIKGTPFEKIIRQALSHVHKSQKTIEKDELRRQDWEQGYGRVSKEVYEQLYPYIVGISSCKTLEKLKYIRYTDQAVDIKVINMLEEMKG